METPPRIFDEDSKLVLARRFHHSSPEFCSRSPRATDDEKVRDEPNNEEDDADVASTEERREQVAVDEEKMENDGGYQKFLFKVVSGSTVVVRSAQDCTQILQVTRKMAVGAFEDPPQDVHERMWLPTSPSAEAHFGVPGQCV